MGHRLLVIAGPDEGRVFPLSEGGAASIGTSRKNSDICLHDPQIARVHCAIKVKKDHALLTSSDSSTPTFVNDKRVTQKIVQVGDVIRLGTTELLFEEAKEASAAGEETVIETIAIADETDDVIEVAAIDSEPEPAPAPAVSPAVLKPPAGLRHRWHDLVGKKVAHYEVGTILGQGPASCVFHARDLKKDVEVALKLLHPDFPQNDAEIQQFIRAMKSWMPLRHPHVVSLLGAGRTEVYVWLALEYVEGMSLTQLLELAGSGGMLGWRHVLRFAIHIGRALGYAHDHAVFHRHITPQNIVVLAAGKVAKLNDILLAQALEGGPFQRVVRRFTEDTDLVYHPPELIDSPGAPDARSDLYALGVVMYALLTGRPPFLGQTQAETLNRIRSTKLPGPKTCQFSMPDGLDAVVLRMLARDPASRYQSAADIVEALGQVASEEGVTVDAAG